MQNNQDAERSMDKVQREKKRIKKSSWGHECLCCVCCTVKTQGKSLDNQDTETSNKARQNKRIPVGVKIFLLVQTGTGAYPSLVYNLYWVSFLGVKRPGRGVNQSLQSSAEVKESVELYLFSPLGYSWPIVG
jgi:hypothetical protein